MDSLVADDTTENGAWFDIKLAMRFRFSRRASAHTLVAATLGRIIGYKRVHRLGLSPAFPLHAPLLSSRHMGMIFHHQNLNAVTRCDIIIIVVILTSWRALGVGTWTKLCTSDWLGLPSKVPRCTHRLGLLPTAHKGSHSGHLEECVMNVAK